MSAFSRGCGILAVAGLLVAAGCLRKEVIHTIYVSPAAVEWSSIEKDVRSDDTDPAARMLQEQDYILGARAAQHGIARALRAIGATRIDTTILRRDRPFTVVTAGQFGDLGELARAMLAAARLRGDASVERDGCTRTFRAWVDPESGANEDSDAIADLFGESSTYRIALTDGRFVRADGFDIEQDGVVAMPAPRGAGEDGIARVSLTWTEGWCGVSR
jgi:hypothetical protein